MKEKITVTVSAGDIILSPQVDKDSKVIRCRHKIIGKRRPYEIGWTKLRLLQNLVERVCIQYKSKEGEIAHG